MTTFLRALCIVFFTAFAGGCNLLASDLHKAVSSGDIAEVRFQLSQQGVDVNATDPFGFTPMHRALDENYDKIAGMLIKAGADLNVEDILGRSLTDYAIVNGGAETAVVLIQARAAKRANFNAKNKDGRILLHWAAEEGRPEIVAALARAGADVNAKNEDDLTVLHIAASEGNAEAAYALTQLKAYTEAKNRDGDTPLHVAVKEGHTETVVALLKGKANIHAKAENDATPLHLAAKEGDVETARALLKAGANVNAKDIFGLTPEGTAKNEHGENSDIVLTLKSAKK